jgi:predicted HAD superfamily Cof-like phosphohydrolase
MHTPEIATSTGNKKLGAFFPALTRRTSVHQNRVEQMMVKIRELSKKTPLRETPGLAPPEHVLKQCKLVFEECMELMEACGVSVRLKTERQGSAYYAEGEAIVTRDDVKLTMDKPPTEDDLPHIAKEIADVSVVNTGMFVEFGLSDLMILEEVDVANLRKFGDGCYVDENGKLRKPPDFKDADIRHVLVQQGWQQEPEPLSTVA